MMGCSTSRLDNEEVVMLCKERKRLIKQAMDQRNTLAEAHVCYIHSLRSIGYALRQFAEMKNISLGDQQHKDGSETPPCILTLRANEPSAAAAADLIPSLPENNIANNDADLALSTPQSSSPCSPRTPESAKQQSSCSSHSCPHSPCENSNNSPCSPAVFESPHHYLRSLGNPAMLVEERHPSPETMRMDSYVLPHYVATDFFRGDNMAMSHLMSRRDLNDDLTPPPPPPPPRNFAWDFFNPFSPLEDQFGLPSHSRPSRGSEEDLRQVREEEGIPDLEEDGAVVEEKKEVQFEQKTVETVAAEEEEEPLPPTFPHTHEQPPAIEEDNEDEEEEEKLPIMEGHGDETVQVDEDEDEGELKHKVEVVNAVSSDVVSEKKDLAVMDSTRTRNLIDVMRGIEDQFTRAYASGKEVSRMLEANKVYYHSGFSEIREQSAKVLNAITWHRSLCSPSSLPRPYSFCDSRGHMDDNSNDFTEDFGMMSGSHASTLERLYAWEKKLYDEVKAGERTRIIYERKCSQLRSQDAKGEDPQAVDKTRAAIRDLYTRIRVAIQAVDSVSKKIQKLRDDELQPQLLELSHGFMQMWKIMLESHATQNQIIAEAQCLANSARGGVYSESHRQAILKVEAELQKWHNCFSKWINAQKAYVQALNSWLLKCIIQEPEAYLKGKIMFSPRRIGAPTIFSICKSWVHAYEKLPDDAVIESIRGFAGDIRYLLLRQHEEEHQKCKADRAVREFDRRFNSLQRYDSRLLESHYPPTDNKYLSDSGQPVTPQSESESRMSIDSFRRRAEEEKAKHQKVMEQTRHATLSTLHTGLKFIFEALTEFSSASLKSYEEICKINEWDDSMHSGSNLPPIKDG